MPIGYVTADMIDLNEFWYGGPNGGPGIQNVVDQYKTVRMPLIESLMFKWGRGIMKFGLSERNGFQALGFGQRPDRKYVRIANIYPKFAKYGYAVGTDLDTLRLSNGREIQMALDRPMKEYPEHLLEALVKLVVKGPGLLNAGYGWWNGEFAPEELISQPPNYQQNTFPANHTHYVVADTLGSLTLPDLTAAKQTIRHHGHMGPLAALINSAQVQELEDLASFTQSSIIRSPISDQVAISGFGETFMLLGITFHVTEMMPAGYVAIFEINQAEGDRPIVMFEPENMQGLQLHPGVLNDYPLVESYWDTWFGLKVMQRGAGVVIDLEHVSYTDPVFVEPTP